MVNFTSFAPEVAFEKALMPTLNASFTLRVALEEIYPAPPTKFMVGVSSTGVGFSSSLQEFNIARPDARAIKKK